MTIISPDVTQNKMTSSTSKIEVTNPSVTGNHHTIYINSVEPVLPDVGFITYAPTKCEIVLLDVRDAYQKMGYGAQLFDLALQNMKECPVVTGSAKRGAVEFYRSLGAELLKPLSSNWYGLVPMSIQNKYYQKK